MLPFLDLNGDYIQLNNFYLNEDSILRCYQDGEFDVEAYTKYKHDQLCAEIEATQQVLHNNRHNMAISESESVHAPPKKRMKRIILSRRTEDGELVAIPPTESLWYNLYISCPQTNDKRFLQKFRHRFRLPYHKFVSILEEATNENWFPKWADRKLLNGKRHTPLSLLILGSLRYLGRGFTFDDCEECTAISEEVHHTFFHEFIAFGITTLFNGYDISPTTAKEAPDHLAEFEMAGMPSWDGTHVVHERFSDRLTRLHKGCKSKTPTSV